MAAGDGLGSIDESQQLSDRSMRFIRMPEPLIGADPILIPPADLVTFDDTAGFKIGDDPLHGALGDSYMDRHLSQHERRIPRQDHQHVRMVRQKRPMGADRRRLRTRRVPRRNDESSSFASRGVRRQGLAGTLPVGHRRFSAGVFHKSARWSKGNVKDRASSEVIGSNMIIKCRI